jgi:hypothetical protein
MRLVSDKFDIHAAKSPEFQRTLYARSAEICPWVTIDAMEMRYG